jgi:hypothetical protein
MAVLPRDINIQQYLVRQMTEAFQEKKDKIISQCITAKLGRDDWTLEELVGRCETIIYGAGTDKAREVFCLDKQPLVTFLSIENQMQRTGLSSNMYQECRYQLHVECDIDLEKKIDRKRLNLHPKLSQREDTLRIDTLRKRIQELSQQNVFVRKVSDMARHKGLTELETLMQMVVVLAEENNRLQDELLKAEYQKTFSVSVSVDNASIEKLKPLLEAAYWYGEQTGDYGMENIEQNESIMLLIASAAKG